MEYEARGRFYKLKLSSLLGIVSIGGMVWFLFGLGHVFLQMSNVQFFPSSFWAGQFGFVIRLFSWFCGATFWFAVMVVNQRSPRSPFYEESLKKIIPMFLLIVGSGAAAYMFQAALLVTAPSAITAVIGKPGAAIVVVENPNASDLRGCRNSVEISSERIYFNGNFRRLCGIKPDFRDTLKEGDRLTLFGKTSFAGIYVKRIGKLKASAPPTEELQPRLDRFF